MATWSWHCRAVVLTGFRFPPLATSHMENIEFPITVELKEHQYTYPFKHIDYTVEIDGYTYGIGWFETNLPEVNEHNIRITAMHERSYKD